MSRAANVQTIQRAFGPVLVPLKGGEYGKLARRIDLALHCPKLCYLNFFSFTAHAGRLRFYLGHGAGFPRISQAFRQERLTLRYSITVAREGSRHRQHVSLVGKGLYQTIEAIGVPRPQSKQGSLRWRWICPECELPADLLVARLGQSFACLECHGRSAEFTLTGTFAAMPPEARR